MTLIKVMTYNIRHARGTDDRVDLNRIASVLSESGADIICLQEVDRGLPRSGMIHQAEALAQCLDFHFAYHANFGLPVAGMGNAILSRIPIYSMWNNPLPSSGEPRGLLQAGLDHPIAKISVFCAHWGLDEHQRRKQAQESAQIVRHYRNFHDSPVLFCGDLNAFPSSQEVKDLLRQSELVDPDPHDALTYPADAPTAKIDYVLTTREAVVSSVMALDSDASDHLPVMAEIEIAQ